MYFSPRDILQHIAQLDVGTKASCSLNGVARRG